MCLKNRHIGLRVRMELMGWLMVMGAKTTLTQGAEGLDGVLGWWKTLTFLSKESTMGVVIVVLSRKDQEEDIYAREERKPFGSAETR